MKEVVIRLYGSEQNRTYDIDTCIAFRKTSEPFGGLSNMAPGYKIDIYGIEFLTSEALYQACRFPNHPEIQKQIIKQHSPMYAKDVSKKYANLTREDWDIERVKIMRWALRAKLVNNWYSFGELLKSTNGKIIVEDSPKDTFWGAQKIEKNFVGINALGRLLMQLREQYLMIENQSLIKLVPPKIENFIIVEKQIGTISLDVSKQLYGRNEMLW
ncbi:hypothetical protein SDC9_146308 [bioreactor metagenome]|uniref:NADAR domain-containing protein n=1 Tax=bioreactor metagenome TaxID=1076179 RepID=A0A645EAW4_9ZZZZ